MVDMEENYIAPRFMERGVQHLPGGGVQIFRGRGPIAYSLNTPILLVIYQGSPDHLSRHLWVCTCKEVRKK